MADMDAKEIARTFQNGMEWQHEVPSGWFPACSWEGPPTPNVCYIWDCFGCVLMFSVHSRLGHHANPEIQISITDQGKPVNFLMPVEECGRLLSDALKQVGPRKSSLQVRVISETLAGWYYQKYKGDLH